MSNDSKRGRQKKVAWLTGYSHYDYGSRTTKLVPATDAVESTANGLKQLGYEIKLFLPEELKAGKVPLTRDTPVKGTVGMVHRALEQLGVPQPPNEDIPADLLPWANRKLWKTTLGHLRRSKAIKTGRKKVFIKPLLHQKAFWGHVYDEHETCDTIRFLLDDFPVLAQEVVRFVGDEIRLYLMGHRIVGTGWTNLSSEEERQVTKMIQSVKKPKAGWVLDVGYIVQKNGSHKLTVIETNEIFSAGNYGIPDQVFARVFLARWKELMETA